MQVRNVNKSSPSFGYSNILKTLWKKHKLPTVKVGFYGDELDIKNVSLEHLKPKSQGGLSILSNFVLATKQNNSKRGNAPLIDFLNVEAMMKYLKQFEGVKVGSFDGDKYIEMILDTVYKLVDSKGILFK